MGERAPTPAVVNQGNAHAADRRTSPGVCARDEADLVGGAALIEHYKDNPYQTFHHEPSVAAVVIDALLDRPDLLVHLAIESGALRQVDVRWELDEEAQRRHKEFRFNIAIDVTDPSVPIYVPAFGEEAQ